MNEASCILWVGSTTGGGTKKGVVRRISVMSRAWPCFSHSKGTTLAFSEGVVLPTRGIRLALVRLLDSTRHGRRAASTIAGFAVLETMGPIFIAMQNPGLVFVSRDSDSGPHV